MSVRIFWVRAMECMCAQTRPRFILSSKRTLGNGVRTHVDSKRKTFSTGGSEEGLIHDATSHRTASPTHYRLSYSGPHCHPNQSNTLHTELFRSPLSPKSTQHTTDWAIPVPTVTQINPTHYRLSYSPLSPKPSPISILALYHNKEFVCLTLHRLCEAGLIKALQSLLVLLPCMCAHTLTSHTIPWLAAQETVHPRPCLQVPGNRVLLLYIFHCMIR